MANNADILGEEAAVRQIVENDFSATDRHFEDDSTTVLRDNAFRNKTRLTSASFPAASRLGSYAFDGCSNLKEVYLPNLASIGGLTFRSLNIKEINFPSGCTGSLGTSFMDCTSVLRKADLGNVSALGMTSFRSNYMLETMILRRTASVVNWSSANFAETPFKRGFGHIYVPRDLITTYQNTSGWSGLYSGYNDIFRAIEDYTIDGTVEGEFNDSLKRTIYEPVYTLTNQVFDGTNYVDTGVQLFDSDNVFTIIIDWTSTNTNDNNYKILECWDPSNSVGVRLQRNERSYTSAYCHFGVDGSSTGAGDFEIDSSGNCRFYIRSVGTSIDSGSTYGGFAKRLRYKGSTGTPMNHTNTLILGAERNSSGSIVNKWHGTINSIKVYKNALSSYQIHQELGL